jgi:LuxR family transcriptional regulator, maltose regulon positive regulatory protein
MSLISIGVEEVGSARPSPEPPALRTLDVPAVPPRLLRRPSVEALIRAGTRHRILLVTGPAGHGKTTSTAAALRGTVALAWVTLEPSDRDPVRFQRRVTEALGTVGGFPVVPVTSVGELDDALASCCRRLDDLPEEIVLVLDDGGDVLESRAAARRLERVLDRLPEGFPTVVITRRQPPIGIEQRRARGEVAEVGVSQLTFSDDEVAAYLREVWDLAVDDATVRQVAGVADGWPVVLQTLAARLATAPELLGAEVADAGPGELPRLLVRELLDSLTAGDRRFLVDISVLADLDADRCERLTEQTAVAERLRRLQAAGLIVACEAGGGYRHRPLVHELLTEELDGRPGRTSALHAIAAAIGRDEGRWTEAVDHHIAAGDVDLAVRSAEEHLDELLRIDGGGWLSGMLDRVPASSLTDRPRLLVTKVDLALLNGDRETLEASLTILEAAPATFEDGPEVIRRIRAALARLRGDGVEPLVTGSGTTLEPIRSHPLGVALAAEGRHEAASIALRCALEDARRRRDTVREQVTLADLAWQRATAGYLVDADLLVRRATSIATERGFPAPPLPALLAAAQLALDRGRTANALRDALQVRSAASRGSDLALLAEAGMLVSRVLWAQGDTAGAIHALEDVERELSEHTPGGGLISRIARGRASLHLALGDVEGATACAPWITTGPADGLPPEDRLIAAHVHLKLGDARRAREALDTLREAGLGPRLSVHALRLSASAASLVGADLEAERARRAAERIARSAGLFVPTAPRAQPRPRYVSDRDIDRPRAAAAPSRPSSAIEELTGRELEVLHRLASSSNGAIADDLCVSVNTVKTHLKSIYRKLGVTSREAAVYEAGRCSPV